LDRHLTYGVATQVLAELHQLDQALSLHSFALSLALLRQQRVLDCHVVRRGVHLRMRHLLLTLLALLALRTLLRLGLWLGLRLALRRLLLTLLGGGRTRGLRRRLLPGRGWSAGLR
jgi:hypothetical protein